MSEPMTWYTSEEMRHWLRRNNYCEEIANELCDQYAENLQRAFNKGREIGAREALAEPPPKAEVKT